MKIVAAVSGGGRKLKVENGEIRCCQCNDWRRAKSSTMSSYRFFFSYASENHRISTWENYGLTGNHLDHFFQELCKRVAGESGDKAVDVGYCDRDRLKIADFWQPTLVQALEESRVLVTVISPHYLKSRYCGRELEFFRQRFERMIDVGHQQHEHRIVPIFGSIMCNALRLCLSM